MALSLSKRSQHSPLAMGELATTSGKISLSVCYWIFNWPISNNSLFDYAKKHIDKWGSKPQITSAEISFFIYLHGSRGEAGEWSTATSYKLLTKPSSENIQKLVAMFPNQM